MTLKIYSVSELIQGAKAIARGIAGISTERGKDIELTIHAAARLMQGVQVAAQHVYEQLIPVTADATRRDEMAEDLGLTFEREACPARGLIAVTFSSLDVVGSFVVRAGAILSFPGELFPDGQQRTYRLVQDVLHAALTEVNTPLGFGSGIHKLRPQSPDGVVPYSARDLLVVKADAGTHELYAVVRTANAEDTSLDLYEPIQGKVDVTAGNVIAFFAHTAVVAAECVDVGSAGNAPRVLMTLDETTVGINTFGAGLDLHCMIVEMSGGGDAQGPADSDTARQLRLIEDTIACPPGHGNLQHWRELALTCPDVDLDDAVVYQHVRGPGTIDIVCIGRSGSVRSTAYPDANLSFVFGGNNQRVIGDVQALRVQAWVQSQAAYFDDVLVRSMEWDWRGNALVGGLFQTDPFVQASSGLLVYTVPRDGYGPDCGVILDYTPPVNLRHATQLHPTTGAVDASLQSGQRVWVAVGPSTADARHAFATVVTTILTVASDRSFVTVADLSALCPGLNSLYGGVLTAIRWGSAGPLTQPTIDATFAYYDQLGPGSYTEPPRGPRYAREFSTTQATALPGSGVVRWPPEARRWTSSVRESELRARLLKIEGMDDAAVYALGATGTILPDFEPSVFRTLACLGVIPRYGDF